MAGQKVNKQKSDPISKDQEEEMSSALIAQLLAEDNMAQGNGNYYAEYSNDARAYDPYHPQQTQDDSYEENSEDDFDPKKKKYVSKKDVKLKRGRKRKVPPPSPPSATITATRKSKEEEEEPKSTEEQTNTAETREEPKEKATKKAKKPVPEGFNSGVYTELEEENFLKGLETFGRDWGEIQRLVATRDSNSIRSHAQKHFIKMFRDQVPLPDKVKESGEGYTLSGKALDPNSAAAKPYLNRGAMNKSGSKTVVTATTVKNDPMEGVETSKESVKENSEALDTITNAVETQTKELTIGDKVEVVEKKAEKMASNKKLHSKSATPSPSTSSSTSEPYDAKGRTNYSTSRLRRQRDPNSVNYGQISKDDDPLTMIKCEPFTGKPGSNVSGSQPFEISVDSNVLVAMDFHAHLMTTEIIGFLAGEWDKDTMRMTIREAYPCRSIETGQNDINVEMDPTSAIETRQKIEERKLKVVGWYHSHPTFIPDPSLVDIENQRNYQVLCRDRHQHEEMGVVTLEPFVGAIVGPYDPALPGSASVINWFHVSNTNTDRPVPKRLIYDLKENNTLTQHETERLFELLETYKDSSEKAVFAEHWRQDATETKLQKMIKSLGSRMPWVQKQLNSENPFDDAFLTKVQSCLKYW